MRMRERCLPKINSMASAAIVDSAASIGRLAVSMM
jgi:hypothetical protein